MVGPNGFEPSTSSVSRKRSGPAELRAYIQTVTSILTGNLRFRQTATGRGFTQRGRMVAIRRAPGDNLCVKGKRSKSGSTTDARLGGPFVPGAIVIVTLSNPREKFWGMILALAAEGLSLSGAELASFEDLTVMVRDGEPFTPAVVFFPMHRIERVELDLPDGNLPSLSQRFLSKTGRAPGDVLTPDENPEKLSQRVLEERA